MASTLSTGDRPGPSAMAERSLGIDVLRVIAVALVVFSHYGLLDDRLMLGGTHGVVIFFMVSGYCMVYSTQQRTGGAFLAARFWRLVPALVLCATLTTMVELGLPNVLPERLHTLRDFLANVVCLPTGNVLCDAAYGLAAGRPAGYSWVDGAYWSLLVEIRFYLLLWLLVYVLRLRRAYFPIALLGALAWLDLSSPSISKSSDFLLYLCFFAFGLAYRAWTGGDRLAPAGMLLAGLAFLVNGLIGSTAISMTLDAGNLVGYTLCFVIFWVIMRLFAAGTNRVVSTFGVLSYPLYLLHQDIGLIVIKLLQPAIGQPGAAIASLVLVLALAAAVQKLIDARLPDLRAAFRRVTGWLRAQNV